MVTGAETTVRSAAGGVTPAEGSDPSGGRSCSQVVPPGRGSVRPRRRAGSRSGRPRSDHDRASFRPVLREHRIIPHRPVEPEAVSLVAGIEHRLEARCRPAAAAARPRPPRRRRLAVPSPSPVSAPRRAAATATGSAPDFLRPPRERRRGLTSGSASSASGGITGGGTSLPMPPPPRRGAGCRAGSGTAEMLAGVELRVWAIHTSVMPCATHSRISAR